MRRSRALGRFLRDQGGSATVEGVLWMPIFAVMLGVIIDMSMMFHDKAEISQAIYDTNRAVAVSAFPDAATAEAALTARLQTIAKDAEATVIKGATTVETRVTVPADSISTMGAIPLFKSLIVNMSYSQMLEP